MEKSKSFPTAREALRETTGPHVSVAASMSREWTDYIQRQIAQHERTMSRAIAQVLVEEERQREALAERVATLEAELAELRTELREIPRGLRAVSS